MSGKLPGNTVSNSVAVVGAAAAAAGDYRKELTYKIYQNRGGTSPEIDIYLIPTVNNGDSIEIPCHRIFLRQCECEYLNQLLSLNTSLKINIDTDPVTLETIVKYIYTGEIDFNFKLNSANFINLFRAAIKFDLKNVIQKCNNYKSSIIISQDNWLQFLRLANAENDKKIIKKVFYFLKEISSEFYNSEAFLSLDLNEIKQILSCTIPRIFENEEDFTKSRLKWFSHLSERNIYINEISKLRWIDKEIVDLSDSDSEIQTSSNYITSTSNSVEVVPKRPRLEVEVINQEITTINENNTEDIHIIFNVQNTEQNTTPGSFYSYSLKTRIVSEISKMKEYIKNFQLVTSDKKQIVRIGGLDKDENLVKSQFQVYNSISSMLIDNRFINVNESKFMFLKAKLVSFTSIFYNSSMLLVGGKSKDTGKLSTHIRKIDFDYRCAYAYPYKEDFFGRMLYERKSPAVAILRANLYISGGIGRRSGNPDSQNARLKSFEMADLRKPLLKPRLMSPMARAKSGHKLIALEDKLYAIGGFIWTKNDLERSREVEIYDPEKNKWSFGTPMINSRAEFAAFIMGKHIYVLGGNQDTNCQNMEKYDPGSNTWSMENCAEFPANSNFFISTIVKDPNIC